MKKTYLSLAAIVSASFLAYSCSCTTPKKPVAEAPAPVKQEVQQQAPAAPAPVTTPEVSEEERLKEIFQRIHFNFD
ncbi:MAG: hypothetical protein C0192_08135, partial [Desulfurella multipotens]